MLPLEERERAALCMGRNPELLRCNPGFCHALKASVASLGDSNLCNMSDDSLELSRNSVSTD